jgi:hypothetical protein
MIPIRQRYPETYAAWSAMRTRCCNPNYNGYRHYGGRGIKICARWDDFELFLQDMGPKPHPKHTLDRIDVNGDYEPRNCRWATWTEQARNKRNTVIVQYDGVDMHLTDAAVAAGIGHSTLYSRIHRGVTIEELFDKSLRHKISEGVTRAASKRTHCRRGHEYTPETTYRKTGGVGRMCKTCLQITQKGRLSKLRELGITANST